MLVVQEGCFDKYVLLLLANLPAPWCFSVHSRTVAFYMAELVA